MKKNITSYSVSAGLFAPIFYLILVTVLGVLEPGCSHRIDMMSILGVVVGLRV